MATINGLFNLPTAGYVENTPTSTTDVYTLYRGINNTTTLLGTLTITYTASDKATISSVSWVPE